MKFYAKLILATSLLFCTLKPSQAQSFNQFGPDGFVKIEEGSGGFYANLDSGDRFSRDHDLAGDINGDGVLDIVVGARSDDDGETDAGAVYILFMNNDGTVQSNQKISMLEGGFTEILGPGDFFGYGVAGIGDYDLDGIPDIAVASTGSSNRSLYIIHLNNDGTVKDYVKNTSITAQGLTSIGDINNDGRIDLVACDPNSDLGGTDRGAIRILFLDALSEVVASETVTISSATGGFGTGLANGDSFGGREVAMIGDLDSDGNPEMAVGAFKSDGGKGAVWILSLDATTHTVISKLKITEGLNGFDETLDTDPNPNGTVGAQLGHAMCKVGDLNGDGIPDLVTGANQQGLGDAYILFLNSDKSVKSFIKIDELEGGYNLVFDPSGEERFSRSISYLGDLRGDGTIAVNIGGGAGGTGTLYLLFLKPCTLSEEPGFNRWSTGNTLFSNWNHPTQMLSGPAQSLEQCTQRAFENNAPYYTHNAANGRCICKDSTAVLVSSTEMSSAYTNHCSTFLSSVVPVSLSAFNAQEEHCEIHLNWISESEENFSHYNIEWSSNGEYFNTITSIESNFDQDNQYTFKHKSAALLNYYRLQMVDFDGTFEYSKIITIQSACDPQTYTIYPNPFTEQLTIDGNFENIKIQIFNQLGQLISEYKATSAPFKLDLSHLESGLFTAKISRTNSADASIYKLIKK